MITSSYCFQCYKTNTMFIITVCPELELDHGVVNGNMRTLGAAVTYSCEKNYVEANGRTRSTCEQTGKWSYIPRCIIGTEI